MNRRRVVVHGRVQGVFFRQACLDTALTTGVAGWVRNNPDGTVEAVFEGPGEAVAAMARWVEHGPPLAEVSRIESTEEEPEGLSGFRVRYDAGR